MLVQNLQNFYLAHILCSCTRQYECDDVLYGFWGFSLGFIRECSENLYTARISAYIRYPNGFFVKVQSHTYMYCFLEPVLHSEQMLLSIGAQLCTRRECKTFRPRRPSSIGMHKVHVGRASMLNSICSESMSTARMNLYSAMLGTCATLLWLYLEYRVCSIWKVVFYFDLSQSDFQSSNQIGRN